MEVLQAKGVLIPRTLSNGLLCLIVSKAVVLELSGISDVEIIDLDTLAIASRNQVLQDLAQKVQDLASR